MAARISSTTRWVFLILVTGLGSVGCDDEEAGGSAPAPSDAGGDGDGASPAPTDAGFGLYEGGAKDGSVLDASVPSQDEDAAAAPDLAACDAIESELLGIVAESRSCVTDDDCTLIDTECTLLYVRDHCSGALYVSTTADFERLRRLDAALTDCHYAQPVPDTTDHCGECNEEPCVAACVDGRCTEAGGSACNPNPK